MECCLFRRQNRKKTTTTTIFMRQSSEFLCKFFEVIILVLMSNMKWASSHNSKMVRRKWNYQLLSIGSNLCRFQYFQNIYANIKTNSLTLLNGVSKNTYLNRPTLCKINDNKSLKMHRKNGSCLLPAALHDYPHILYVCVCIFPSHFYVFRLILRFVGV